MDILMIKYLFETLAILAICYGIWNEEKLVEIEERAAQWLKELYVVLRQYARKKVAR